MEPAIGFARLSALTFPKSYQYEIFAHAKRVEQAGFEDNILWK
jgi:hypothetical protein